MINHDSTLHAFYIFSCFSYLNMSMNFTSIKNKVLRIKTAVFLLCTSIFVLFGGEYRSRTDDLLRARQAL